MAISTFANNVTSGQGTVASGGTFTVTKPTGCANGDVAWIFACASDQINGFTSPGWTQLFNVAETGLDSGMWVARKVISGDGATWTITSTGGENYAWICIALRGVNNTTPEGATACTSKASSASQVCGPVTVTDPAAWLLCAAECDPPSPGATYTGPGGGFVVDANSVESASSFVSIGAGHHNLGGTTGSISRTLTSTIADLYVAAALEILPAADAGRPKTWTGSAWQTKPMKMWTGSAWVEKPVKFWTGSIWDLA